MPPSALLFGEVLADVFPQQTVLGGAPFNVARHLQAFDLQPLLLTRTGDDALRQILLDTMHGYGMTSTGVQLDSQYPTGKVLVHMHGHEHHFEIVDKQAYDYIELEATPPLPVQAPSIFYFGTLAQRNALSRSTLIHLLEHTEAKKFLDLNLRTPWYTPDIISASLQHADIVKMNEDELLVLKDVLTLPGNTMETYARHLIKQFDIETLLVTAGERGAWQVNQDERIISADVHSYAGSALVDTVGAGDAFSAAYIVGYFAGWPAYIKLGRANQFAGAMCTLRGGVPESMEFYKPFLQEWLATRMASLV